MRITESKLRSIIRSVLREYIDPTTGLEMSDEEIEAYKNDPRFQLSPEERAEKKKRAQKEYEENQRWRKSLEGQEEPEYDLGGMPIR